MKKVNGIKLSALTLLASLAACGSDPQMDNPYYNVYNAVAGGCQVPVGTKLQTVKGNLGNGATVTLDLYQDPTGSISAVGEVNIPSLDSLYSNNLLTGSVAGQGLRTCVSSNGAAGSLDNPGAYRDLEISVRGQGVYIEMGSRVGVQAYLSGSNILGSMYMEFPLDPSRYPPSTFALTY